MVLGSFGTWDYNNANSKINARVYGGTIAHEILVNDYYVERNVFLNFATNSRKHWFEVKNYARDDDKNNADHLLACELLVSPRIWCVRQTDVDCGG